MKQGKFVVAFDDVALQLGETGIARYWRELITSSVELGVFSENGIEPIFLSRSNFRTPIDKAHVAFPAYDFRYPAMDRQLISKFCEAEKVDLFVSSYYTFSSVSLNLMLIYDLIPEVFGFDRMNRGWMERKLAIYAASSYFTISQNTKRDLVKFYPHALHSEIGVGYPGVKTEIFNHKEYDPTDYIHRENRYFVCIGSRYGEGGYKNGKLLVDAINLLKSNEINFELHFIGGEPLTKEELALKRNKGVLIHAGRLSDSELVRVLKNAEALIYPSKYEGFGMPPLEALALGVPVITTESASIPEAVGNLALLIDSDDAIGLANLLRKRDFSKIKEVLANLGPKHAVDFSWDKTAKEFGAALSLALRSEQPPGWKLRREILKEYSQIALNLQT